MGAGEARAAGARASASASAGVSASFSGVTCLDGGGSPPKLLVEIFLPPYRDQQPPQKPGTRRAPLTASNTFTTRHVSTN
jgi:hypothetical protein